MSEIQAGEQAVRPRSRRELASLFGGLATLLIAAIIIAGLYLGQALLIPLALAVLLSFVLAPLVGWMERLRLPRGAAVLIAVLLAFGSLLSLAGLLTLQLVDLASELPRYERTLREKAESLRGAADGSSPLERAADVLQELSSELDSGAAESAEPPPVPPPGESAVTPDGALPQPAAEEPRPMPVEIHQPPAGMMERLGAVLGTVMAPLVTCFIILVFVIFILLQREDLRNRLIRLAGAHDISRTTAALDDAAARVSRLFLLQLLVNGSFGVIVGVGLWLMGMPNALLWGVLGTALRFLPFVGFILAGIVPVILAVAIDPGWTLLFWVLGLYVVAESLASHVLEPLVYGKGTGLSPIAVVVSAAFWALLWGPIGLVLAIPITVCLVVMGRHIEGLAFLDVMFGDRPVLSPPQLFYQRMLADDALEAASDAEPAIKETSLLQYYESVALPGLRQAQEDMGRGTLDMERAQRLRDTVLELVDDLLWQEPEGEAPEGEAPEGEALAAPRVLCLGALSPLDEAAAIVVAQLLEQRHLESEVGGPARLSLRQAPALRELAPGCVVLCCLDASRTAHLRYSVRRLRRHLPGVFIAVACWAGAGNGLDLEAVKAQSGADAALQGLQAVVDCCLERAGPVEASAAPESV